MSLNLRTVIAGDSWGLIAVPVIEAGPFRTQQADAICTCFFVGWAGAFAHHKVLFGNGPVTAQWAMTKMAAARFV